MNICLNAHLQSLCNIYFEVAWDCHKAEPACVKLSWEMSNSYWLTKWWCQFTFSPEKTKVYVAPHFCKNFCFHFRWFCVSVQRMKVDHVLFYIKSYSFNCTFCHKYMKFLIYFLTWNFLNIHSPFLFYRVIYLIWQMFSGQRSTSMIHLPILVITFKKGRIDSWLFLLFNQFQDNELVCSLSFSEGDQFFQFFL